MTSTIAGSLFTDDRAGRRRGSPPAAQRLPLPVLTDIAYLPGTGHPGLLGEPSPGADRLLESTPAPTRGRSLRGSGGHCVFAPSERPGKPATLDQRACAPTPFLLQQAGLTCVKMSMAATGLHKLPHGGRRGILPPVLDDRASDASSRHRRAFRRHLFGVAAGVLPIGV